MTSGKKRTREEIEQIVNNLGYELLDDYMIKGNRIVVIQDSKGYKWIGILDNLIRQGISFFEKGNSFVFNNISLWLKLNRPEFELGDNTIYLGSVKKLNFYHNIPKCQEEFEMSWDNISRWQGCSVCAGYQVGKRTSLAYLRPDFVKEWHPDNELNPEEVPEFSNKRVYWICSECGYGNNKEWIAKISDRVRGNGCPACTGKIVTDKNRLSVLFQEISDQWDYDRNSDTPKDVSFGSHKKRYWICPRGHSYLSLISNRTKGQGCGKCSNEKKESQIATELKEFYIKKRNAKEEYPVCVNPESGWHLYYDIYIPFGENSELNGGYIEVQGAQHFGVTGFHHKQARKKKTTPQEEFKYCKKLDRTRENLLEKMEHI